jgi:hypothetical protein
MLGGYGPVVAGARLHPLEGPRVAGRLPIKYTAHAHYLAKSAARRGALRWRLALEDG